MAKKKSKKKSARKPATRRTPWSNAFESLIISKVFFPTLVRMVSQVPASSATSLAQLHTLFETEHNCSIPRPLFNKIAAAAGISFSKGISFQQNTAPAPAQPGGRILNLDVPADQVRLTAISSPFLSQVVKELNTSEPEGEDGFKVTNDAVSPEAAANDEARRQAQIDAAIAEANGEVPEPIIIPRR